MGNTTTTTGFRRFSDNLFLNVLFFPFRELTPYRKTTNLKHYLKRLGSLFGTRTPLRKHLEEKWRMLRDYVRNNPDNNKETSKKRKILGESFANDFLNDTTPDNRKPLNKESWKENREIHIKCVKCKIKIKYVDNDDKETVRKVDVIEVFSRNNKYYLHGFCYLRSYFRTFRVDRIHSVTFENEVLNDDENKIIDIIYKVAPKALIIVSAKRHNGRTGFRK